MSSTLFFVLTQCSICVCGQLNHLTLMEINTVRPFLTSALDLMHVLRSNLTAGGLPSQDWAAMSLCVWSPAWLWRGAAFSGLSKYIICKIQLNSWGGAVFLKLTNTVCVRSLQQDCFLRTDQQCLCVLGSTWLPPWSCLLRTDQLCLYTCVRSLQRDCCPFQN